MSCWWDLDFSVTGSESLTEQLIGNLAELKFDDGARLFDHVKIMSSLPGFVVIHASRNYHGAAAISELIARFPDLLFHGSLHSLGGGPGTAKGWFRTDEAICINMKTARAFGLTVPQSLLARADQVIE